MDNKNLYVTDPAKWVAYYNNMSKGKTNQYGRMQIGGSFNGSSGSYITPIESKPHTDGKK